jgi:transcription factor SFP1
MSGIASAIDIATARQNSSSPRNQQSNLTSQLQQPTIDVRSSTPTTEEVAAEAQNQADKSKQDSTSMFGTTPYGARQIPIANGQRRDNAGMSGSLVGGMSWGGISMGSFIRDE